MSNNNIGVDGVLVLTPAFEALQSLKVLDLSHNPLTFRHAGHLEGENYYTAGITPLAESLSSCVRLEKLNLTECALGDEGGVAFARAFQVLTELREVQLVENDIEELGQEAIGQALRNCRAMVTADSIRAEQIREGQHVNVALIYQVSFIANCLRRDDVSKIDLSNNNLGRSNEALRDLMQGLGQMRNLTDLNLNGNKPFSREVTLTLGNSLKHMTSVRSLRLADNGISGDGADAIVCTLVRLFQIEILDVSRNDFTHLPVALAISCPIMWKMDVSENPWHFPSREIMAKSSIVLRATLNQEFLNGTIDREMGLVFIGETEVGKSSLIYALMSDDDKSPHVKLDHRTCGIELHTWKPLTAKASPLYNIQDFGGLDIYNNIQLSLSLIRRAIYCLVWRPFSRQRQEERTRGSQDPLYRIRGHGLCTRDQVLPFLREQAIPWIDKLFRRVPGFTFILIATHLDTVEQEDVAWQSEAVKDAVTAHLKDLEQRFSYITPPSLLCGGASTCVSTRTGENVGQLQELLLQETVKLPFYGEILPKSWMNARKAILQIRNMHRAVLRTRKKEILHRHQNPLLAESAHGVQQYPHHSSDLADSLLDDIGSESENERSDDAGEEGPKQIFKYWHHFATRTLLRVRLKRMMAITPELAKGSMWIGHFKNLIKDAGIEQSQTLSVMRYFHDAGWIRCYGFDDSKLSKFRSNEYDGGFEMLDPVRSSVFKLATNSYASLHRKDSPLRPDTLREEAWNDMCDTIFLDLQWLFHMTFAIVKHDGTHTIASQHSVPLRDEAVKLYSNGDLSWGPGTPNLLSRLWRMFLPEHEFRRVRNVLESKSILEPLPGGTAGFKVKVLQKTSKLRGFSRLSSDALSAENDAPRTAVTEAFLTTATSAAPAPVAETSASTTDTSAPDGVTPIREESVAKIVEVSKE